MKQFLYNKIYAIHTIKCWKTNDFNVALQSFNRLGELKAQVFDAPDEATLTEIHNQINQWAGSEPIALEVDIEQIIG
ncbi:MAG: hypothetical protein H6598_09570 [Flavobacteriales bacterium]|nr:hypothetical protein [Flavobacteriales bacterium]